MPFTQIKTLFVGGGTDIGFDVSSRYLLAASHAGRGLFDVLTCELVARDHLYDYSFIDQSRGAILGIGPVEGVWISGSGIMLQVPFRSPRYGYLLEYIPGTPCLIKVDGEIVSKDDGELRALDISPDGNSLALVYSDGIDFYKRTTESVSSSKPFSAPA